jgi:hypothetical protein
MHVKESSRHTFLPELLVYVLNAKASILKSNWQNESHETNRKDVEYRRNDWKTKKDLWIC